MVELSSAVLSKALCKHFTEEVRVDTTPDGLVAVLPFLDIYGDCISLYVQPVDDGYYLTDGGFAHHELSASLGTSKADHNIWIRVEELANHFGVDFDGGELNAVAASGGELGAVSMALAQAVAESMSLHRGVVPPVSVQFWEEVELFLSDNRIAHTVNQRVLGTSGANHKVDFVLQNGSAHVAQAIASEQSLRRSLNIFYYVTEKDPSLKPLAFIDDAKEYSSASFQQLAYKANVFQWGKRTEFLRYWERVHR
jgi:hypothetical protein